MRTVNTSEINANPTTFSCRSCALGKSVSVKIFFHQHVEKMLKQVTEKQIKAALSVNQLFSSAEFYFHILLSATA